MTYCLEGHWCGGRRRGNESLISSHLGFTIPDLRSYTPHRVNPSSAVLLRRTGRISSIVNFRPQRPFKIKKPSPNAKKLLKVNKGQLRLYDTPRAQKFICQNRPQKNTKALILLCFIHFPTVKCMSFFTPKNLRYMNDFQQCKLLNKSQRTLAIIASTCRIAALRRAKPGSAYLARIEAHWRKTGLSRRSRRRRRIKPSQAGNQGNQAKSNQKSGSMNKTQGPTSNIQRNAKGQCSLPGMWSFSGAWKLEFGFFTLILVPEYLTQYITRTTASTIERSLPLIAIYCHILPAFP